MENRFSILIIDDVEENIYSLKLLIEEFDVDIYSALSASEGISILTKHPVDLILCDIQMPDIDGFQFAEYLKGIDSLKDIPIIFVTGIYDKDSYQQRGYDLGAIEYITKPIDDVLLTSKLKVYIDLFNKNKETKESLELANKLVVHNTKMASIGEMIGVISHQLKQPLNVLSLYCEDIKYSYDYGDLDKETVDDFSVNTKKQIHHMKDTIDGFLGFFNPNKPKQNFSVVDSLKDSLELMHSHIDKNKVQLHEKFDDDFLLNGITMELSQVVMNFITNSIQAFIERGIKERNIEIRTYSEHGKNYITFTDDAGGIKEDNLEKIFDPYFTTKSEGSGIGLYMVKLVVTKTFGGNLSLENFEKGVRFILEFDKVD